MNPSPQAASPAGEAAAPAAGLRVQLLIEHPVHRALVQDLLGRPGCEAAPDLLVVDAAGLTRHAAYLESCRRESAPQALPCLLLLSPRSPGPSAALASLVDDILRAPVRRRELMMRIEALARTRRLSLALGRQADEVRQRYEQLSVLHGRLQASQRTLKVVSAQKSQLLGTVAHDLRNPLALVHQCVARLRPAQITMEPAERDELFRVAAETTTHMLNMLDGLLNEAHIESGRLHLDLRYQDVGTLVDTSVRLYRTIAQQEGVEIRYAAVKEPLMATVDGPKIRQVIDNLLGNAVKFSGAGTRVDVGLMQASGTLEISVQDEGPGVAVDDLENLFAPFQQGSTGTKQQGAGLGLAIAWRIVDGHGGRLTVDEGAGATFRVVLPTGPVPSGDAPFLLADAIDETTVLDEEDHQRLQQWRDVDAVEFARAVENLHSDIPATVARLSAAASETSTRQLERVAYRAGWLVRRFSADTFEAALRLEAAVRERDPQATATTLRDLTSALEGLRHEVQAYRVPPAVSPPGSTTRL